jgi:hypothetical protein
MARSLSPTTLETSIPSNSAVASSEETTGVTPLLTEWRGPRTECAGFDGITWPATNQSNNIRMQARCCLTEGAFMLAELLDIRCDVERLDLIERADSTHIAPMQKRGGSAPVCGARVRITDVDGEEIEEVLFGALPRRSDDRGKPLPCLPPCSQ